MTANYCLTSVFLLWGCFGGELSVRDVSDELTQILVKQVFMESKENKASDLVDLLSSEVPGLSNILVGNPLTLFL